ncbi:hypothetical protein QBC40DRAFT_259803 [Triangularia verruculosa]|uniref:Uncharacterized protein n=1 Tax=Triangularia verruculosa TaxID=2587418 RepID=A0AAN7AR63_9PEZI|nr:hypothetical protein QBC40DRAFT_259803 [Triangularia verruculosa]
MVFSPASPTNHTNFYRDTPSNRRLSNLTQSTSILFLDPDVPIPSIEFDDDAEVSPSTEHVAAPATYPSWAGSWRAENTTPTPAVTYEPYAFRYRSWDALDEVTASSHVTSSNQTPNEPYAFRYRSWDALDEATASSHATSSNQTPDEPYAFRYRAWDALDESTTSNHVTFSNQTPDHHGRRRRRFAATPFPRRGPRTRHTTISSRGLEGISNESEEEVLQPRKRRKLNKTPPSHTRTENAQSVAEDEDQIAALLSFSPLDSISNGDDLTERWMEYIVGIDIEDLEDWSDTTAPVPATALPLPTTLGTEAVDEIYSDIFKPLLRENYARLAGTDYRVTGIDWQDDPIPFRTIIDLRSQTPEPRSPSYPVSPSFSPER